MGNANTLRVAIQAIVSLKRTVNRNEMRARAILVAFISDAIRNSRQILEAVEHCRAVTWDSEAAGTLEARVDVVAKDVESARFSILGTRSGAKEGLIELEALRRLVVVKVNPASIFDARTRAESLTVVHLEASICGVIVAINVRKAIDKVGLRRKIAIIRIKGWRMNFVVMDRRKVAVARD